MNTSPLAVVDVDATQQFVDATISSIIPTPPFIKCAVVSALVVVANHLEEFMQKGFVPGDTQLHDRSHPDYMYERLLIIVFVYECNSLAVQVGERSTFRSLTELQEESHQDAVARIRAFMSVHGQRSFSASFIDLLYRLENQLRRRAEKLNEAPPCGAYVPVLEESAFEG